jgi:hypothetical protein
VSDLAGKVNWLSSSLYIVRWTVKILISRLTSKSKEVTNHSWAIVNSFLKELSKHLYWTRRGINTKLNTKYGRLFLKVSRKCSCISPQFGIEEVWENDFTTGDNQTILRFTIRKENNLENNSPGFLEHFFRLIIPFDLYYLWQKKIMLNIWNTFTNGLKLTSCQEITLFKHSAHAMCSIMIVMKTIINFSS